MGLPGVRRPADDRERLWGRHGLQVVGEIRRQLPGHEGHEIAAPIGPDTSHWVATYDLSELCGGTHDHGDVEPAPLLPEGAHLLPHAPRRSPAPPHPPPTPHL